MNMLNQRKKRLSLKDDKQKINEKAPITRSTYIKKMEEKVTRETDLQSVSVKKTE